MDMDNELTKALAELDQKVEEYMEKNPHVPRSWAIWCCDCKKANQCKSPCKAILETDRLIEYLKTL